MSEDELEGYKEADIDDCDFLEKYIGTIHLELKNEREENEDLPPPPEEMINDAIDLYRHLDNANDDKNEEEIVECTNQIFEFINASPNSPMAFSEETALRLFINVCSGYSIDNIICPLFIILSKITLFSTQLAELLVDLNIHAAIANGLRLAADDQVHELALQCLIDVASSSKKGWRSIIPNKIRRRASKTPLELVMELYQAIMTKKISFTDNIVLLLMKLFAALFNDHRDGSQFDGLPDVLDILFPKSDESKPALLISLHVCAIAAKCFYSYFQSIYRQYMGNLFFLSLLDLEDPDISEMNDGANDGISEKSENEERSENRENPRINSEIRCAVLATFIPLIKSNMDNNEFQEELFNGGLFDKMLRLMQKNEGEEPLLCLQILQTYAQKPQCYQKLLEHEVMLQTFELIKDGTYDTKLASIMVFANIIRVQDAHTVDFIMVTFPQLFAEISEFIGTAKLGKLWFIIELMEQMMMHADRVDARDTLMSTIDLNELIETVEELKHDVDSAIDEPNLMSLKVNLDIFSKHLEAILNHEEYESD